MSKIKQTLRVIAISLGLVIGGGTVTQAAAATAPTAQYAARATECIVFWDQYPGPGDYRSYCTSSYQGLYATWYWVGNAQYIKIRGRSIANGVYYTVFQDRVR